MSVENKLHISTHGVVQGITLKSIIAEANDQSNLLEQRQTVQKAVSLGKSAPQVF